MLPEALPGSDPGDETSGPNNITGCKNSIHNKHGAATRAILHLEAESPG
jgi:hypothetical protein